MPRDFTPFWNLGGLVGCSGLQGLGAGLLIEESLRLEDGASYVDQETPSLALLAL